MTDPPPKPPASSGEKSLLLAGCAVLVMSIGIFWCISKDVPFIDYDTPVAMRFGGVMILSLTLFAASGHLQVAQIRDVLRLLLPFRIVPRDKE